MMNIVNIAREWDEATVAQFLKTVESVCVTLENRCQPLQKEDLTFHEHRIWYSQIRRMLHHIVCGETPEERKILMTCYTLRCMNVDHMFYYDPEVFPNSAYDVHITKNLPLWDPFTFQHWLQATDQHTQKLPNGCWQWTGNLKEENTPRLNSMNVRLTVYKLLKGDVTGKLHMTCDTPLCVRLDHMFDVTDMEQFKKWRLQQMLKSCIVHPETKCMLYNYTPENSKTYAGTIFLDKNIHAHRLAWILTNGDIASSDIFVRHDSEGKQVCASRRCINVDHLSLGTQQENLADSIQLGTLPRGERCFNSTISDEVATLIKQNKDNESNKQRAERFGTTVAIVHNIDNGLSWTHIPDAHGQVSRSRKTAINAERAVQRKHIREVGVTAAEYKEIVQRAEGRAVVQPVQPNSSFPKPCLILRTGGNKVGRSSFKPLSRPAYLWVFEYYHNNSTLLRPGRVGQVRHLCINKFCIEQTHLQYGTPIMNRQDSLKRKLTPEQALRIFERKAEDRHTLAAEYKVKYNTISAIQRGRSWLSVTQPSQVPVDPKLHLIQSELSHAKSIT